MPELPEVETVKNGLNEILPLPLQVEGFRRSKPKLRFPYPRSLQKHIEGKTLLGVHRRAKYLLFDLGESYLINHLGMTGSWRKFKKSGQKKHDHFTLKFSDGSALVFNDPRRFGYFDWLPKTKFDSSAWFKHLGPEPMSEDFSTEYLIAKLKGRKGPIKNVIMDQKVVVGVGNIYASEALFLTGVRPTMGAHRLNKNQVGQLVKSIKQVLGQAIAAGGTTISDFKQAGGSEGYFQVQLKVYGREGELCGVCQEPIFQKRLGGRSSFYCKTCQKG